jgi:hypothetical protein
MGGLIGVKNFALLDASLPEVARLFRSHGASA